MRVRFEPSGRTVAVPKGVTISEAAKKAGIALNYPCGGVGGCGKCRVRMVEGASEPNDAELTLIGTDDCRDGVRLACQSLITQPAAVEVPETSLLTSLYRILTESGSAVGPADDPPVRKQYVQLPKPTLADDAPDAERLRRTLGPVNIELPLLRDMPRRLRAAGFEVTAVLAGNRLVAVEPGDTEDACYGIAFDIGTTTLVGSLLELRTGRLGATTSRMNPQTSFGDDVLSRILHARESPKGLADLHEHVIRAVNEMIGDLAAAAGVASHHIYEAVFAGNTTMQHLLLGIDPGALGEIPFVSATGQRVEARASELGLQIHPCGRVFVFPTVGGFVGGDITAGLLVTGLAQANRPALFVDIGTNGEIVLVHEGRLLAASCAAGPAFEGARISYGMRAAAGAIEQIAFDGDVRYSVIGDVAPAGLCGSALIDVVAELLRCGALVAQGMLLGRSDLPSKIAPAIRRRFNTNDNGMEFVIVAADKSQTRSPIVLTQRDIRELQLAKAAIRAGIAILLQRAGLRVTDLEKFLVAGAFGNYLRLANAQRIGLLPEDLDDRRFSFVGNTSLAGAQRALLSLRARESAQELAEHTEHIELSSDAAFQTQFAEAMFFPES